MLWPGRLPNQLGGKDYKFVTTETVYEVTDDGPQELEDGGDSLLESLGHDPAAREKFLAVYNGKAGDFDAAKYWADYVKDNNFKPEGAKRKPTKAAPASRSRASSRRATPAAKKTAAARTRSAERSLDEEIEDKHPELSDEIKAFIARLVREEVAKAMKPLQEENRKLKLQVESLERQLADAKKEPVQARTETKSKLSPEEKAEEDRLAKAAGSPFAMYDKLKIDGTDGVFQVRSKPFKDGTDGQWRLMLVDENDVLRGSYKISDLEKWNIKPAPATPTAGTTAAAEPATSPPPASAEARKPRGWFGHRIVTEEEETVYQERYGKRNRSAAIGAAALVLLGGVWAIWQSAETEDIEATVHRIEADQRAPIKKIIIEPRHQESPAPTTSTQSQPPASTTTETTPSASGAQAPPAEIAPDADEPLSGSNTYFENSKRSGDGLQLDYPKNLRVSKNADGSYSLELTDGSFVKLQWNRQGKLNKDTVQALEEHHYEVGWRTTTFIDREGATRTHEYSVIGDQDNP